MTATTNLQPKAVFDLFAAINKVPRPSKHEEKIIEYLVQFGKDHGLETEVDEVGNVIIRKPATPGMENHPTVILQSHSDMVCEKNADVEHDFMNDPNRFPEKQKKQGSCTAMRGATPFITYI